MKHRKKIVAMVLCLTFVCVLLAGCGSESNNTQNPQSGQPENEQTTLANEDSNAPTSMGSTAEPSPYDAPAENPFESYKVSQYAEITEEEWDAKETIWQFTGFFSFGAEYDGKVLLVVDCFSDGSVRVHEDFSGMTLYYYGYWSSMTEEGLPVNIVATSSAVSENGELSAWKYEYIAGAVESSEDAYEFMLNIHLGDPATFTRIATVTAQKGAVKTDEEALADISRVAESAE